MNPPPELQKTIDEYVAKLQQPTQATFTQRFPFLKEPIIFLYRLKRNLYNIFTLGRPLRKKDFFSHVLARHSSLLMRKLGTSDIRLQKNKILNLEKAIAHLDGLVIPPNKIFSLWYNVGQPKKEDGYVDGMLLSNGKIIEGLGGGLCQLSNFLFWILLHTDVQIIERHHHSRDVFPDSGRTLPFGSGATIFYNYVDLKIKNISPHPLQLKLWLTKAHLKGQILSPMPAKKKFHLIEKNHSFIKYGERFFRYNELWRKTLCKGKEIHEEKIVTNFAPVLYTVDENELIRNKLQIITHFL